MAALKALEMADICKSFGPVEVLKGVSIGLDKGEVLGIIGENGAGKSTLIKILCGIYTKNSGTIKIDGREVTIQNASHAQQLGISTIYQELSVVPDLNAVQNIFLNRELAGRGSLISKLDYGKMREISVHILEEILKINLDVDTPVKYLKLAQKQMIEIARTVYADAQIIIMDEPTASLDEKERNSLFEVIENLKSRGKAIIFISHHIDELLQICDSLAILRDGRLVSSGKIEDYTIETIISSMIGKSLNNQYPKHKVEPGKKILTVEKLSRKNSYQDISFDVRAGEILGLVGVEGCGKNEIVRSLFGVLEYDSGTVCLNDKVLDRQGIEYAMKNKIAFVPAERKIEGLFLKQDIAWNTTIASLRALLKGNAISKKSEAEKTNEFIEKLHTKASGPDQNITTLSGGNQQKVMLSRWIMTDADLYLLEEPTRGIDVNAKTEVYEAIGDIAESGKAVILVSSEEEEVMGICDRIIVMKNGGISTILNAADTSTAEIKQYSV